MISATLNKNNQLILYRAISHDKDIQLNKLGVCWTADVKKAYCYGSKDMNPIHYYIYFAYVSLFNVDWKQTIEKHNGHFSYEREFVLLQGKEVEVFKVEKRKKTVETLLDSFDVCFKSVI